MRPIQCPGGGSAWVCAFMYLQILEYNSCLCFWHISRFTLSSKQSTGSSVSVPTSLNQAVCLVCWRTQTTKLHSWAAKWHQAWYCHVYRDWNKRRKTCVISTPWWHGSLFWLADEHWGGSTSSPYVCVYISDTVVFRVLQSVAPFL